MTIILDFLAPLIALLICALIGFKIGEERGRPALGFWAGLLLGPLGWLITAIVAKEKPEPDDGPLVKCPECLGEVPALARKCRHCGSVLPWAASDRPS